MYDPRLVQPMRDELTSIGFKELRSPEEAEEVLGAPEANVLLMINSVCGCAAGSARPGVALAISKAGAGDFTLATVFAGQDREATEKARSYILGFPPSSPAVVVFEKGELKGILERRDIEGYTAEEVAAKLTPLIS